MRCGSRGASAVTGKTDPRAGDRAHPNNVEPTYVPFYASWPNRHTHDRRPSEIVNRAKVA